MDIPVRREMLYCKVTNPGDLERMDYIRELYYGLYKNLFLNLPGNRSASLAYTALEESLMRAIQAIAVEYGEPQEFYYGDC